MQGRATREGSGEAKGTQVSAGLRPCTLLVRAMDLGPKVNQLQLDLPAVIDAGPLQALQESFQLLPIATRPKLSR